MFSTIPNLQGPRSAGLDPGAYVGGAGVLMKAAGSAKSRSRKREGPQPLHGEWRRSLNMPIR